MGVESQSRQVGTKLLFENDRVRVWELVLQPGEASPRHVHEADYVFVHLTKSKLMLMQEGEPEETSEEPPGFVQYTEVGSGIRHAIKNAPAPWRRRVRGRATRRRRAPFFR